MSLERDRLSLDLLSLDLDLRDLEWDLDLLNRETERRGINRFKSSIYNLELRAIGATFYLLFLELSLLREGLLDDDLLRFFLSLPSPSDCLHDAVSFTSAAASVLVAFVELLSLAVCDKLLYVTLELLSVTVEDFVGSILVSLFSVESIFEGSVLEIILMVISRLLGLLLSSTLLVLVTCGSLIIAKVLSEGTGLFSSAELTESSLSSCAASNRERRCSVITNSNVVVLISSCGGQSSI